MMKRLPAFLIVCVMTLTVGAQTYEEWRDSLETLNRMIAQSPRSVDLRLRKAAVNIELEQWEYAAEEYGRVLGIEPANLSAMYFRAYANRHLHRLDMARRDYEHLLSLMPRHFEAQLGLAMVKQQMGRTAEVTDELNQLVQMYPDSALAYAARAGFEMEQKQYELAAYDWGEAMRLQPQNTDFLVSKVDALLFLKRKKEALRLLQQAIGQGVPKSLLKQWLDRSK